MGLTREHHVELAPNVPGWDRLRIRRRPERGISRSADRDRQRRQVAAQAEIAWGALRGVEDGVYLNLGTGIAAGIISRRTAAGGRARRGGRDRLHDCSAAVLEARMAAEGAAPLEEVSGAPASPGASLRRRCPARWPTSSARAARRSAAERVLGGAVDGDRRRRRESLHRDGSQRARRRGWICSGRVRAARPRPRGRAARGPLSAAGHARRFGADASLRGAVARRSLRPGKHPRTHFGRRHPLGARRLGGEAQ